MREREPGATVGVHTDIEEVAKATASVVAAIRLGVNGVAHAVELNGRQQWRLVESVRRVRQVSVPNLALAGRFPDIAEGHGARITRDHDREAGAGEVDGRGDHRGV